jgi:glycosyltransferase involved in cell wall biosynthesis
VDPRISSSAFVIGALGRLTEQKGFRYLLEAAPAILRSCPDALFLIVGDGPDRADLERLARDLGVSERVVWTGYDAEGQRYLGVMDVFAFPSLWESWGLSAVEAMAAGLPIVASDIPGPRAFLENGRTALTVPPSDAAALAGAIVRLSKDPALCRELASNAQRTAEERLSARGFAERVARIYLEA